MVRGAWKRVHFGARAGGEDGIAGDGDGAVVVDGAGGVHGDDDAGEDSIGGLAALGVGG